MTGAALIPRGDARPRRAPSPQPSDVTAFLACEHLTTLSLAPALGDLEKTDVENQQRDVIFGTGSSTSAPTSGDALDGQHYVDATLGDSALHVAYAEEQPRRQSPVSYLNEIDSRTR